MKKSEMIKKLAEAFEEHSDNQQYKGYSHEGLAETFLELAEQLGIRPPFREVFPVHVESTGFPVILRSVYSDTWEPEDE